MPQISLETLLLGGVVETVVSTWLIQQAFTFCFMFSVSSRFICFYLFFAFTVAASFCFLVVGRASSYSVLVLCLVGFAVVVVLFVLWSLTNCITSADGKLRCVRPCVLLLSFLEKNDFISLH